MVVLASTASIVANLGSFLKAHCSNLQREHGVCFDGSSVKLQRADSTRQELPTHIFIMVQELHNFQIHLTLKHFITHSAQQNRIIMTFHMKELSRRLSRA